MPRKPRIYLAGYPQHIVLRGHNRESILRSLADFRYFYRCLKEAAGKHALSIHAWVFMHNHVHLLATPGGAATLSLVIQSVGRRYAQYFNKRYDRSGALWEGRYKAAVVDSETYLLICYRYIELNPVRAGIVTNPGDYPYSSFHRNALGKTDSLVTPHQIYQDLVGEASEMVTKKGLQRYRALFDTALTQTGLDVVRQGTQKQRVICSRSLREQFEQGVGVDMDDSDP